MIARALALVAAAVLCMAATAPKPKPTPAKPVAARAPDRPFDTRDPAALVTMLAAMDATAAPAIRTEDSVALKITSPAGAFAVQFASCAATGRDCQAVLFDAGSDARTATIGDINAFNQTSLTCRVYQDKASGRPHVLYSALLFAGDSREVLHTHIGAWMGCVASFGDFLKDPTAYLASAP